MHLQMTALKTKQNSYAGSIVVKNLRQSSLASLAPYADIKISDISYIKISNIKLSGTEKKDRLSQDAELATLFHLNFMESFWSQCRVCCQKGINFMPRGDPSERQIEELSVVIEWCHNWQGLKLILYLKTRKKIKCWFSKLISLLIWHALLLSDRLRKANIWVV